MTAELLLGVAYGVFGTICVVIAAVAWVAVSGSKSLAEELEETWR